MCHVSWVLCSYALGLCALRGIAVARRKLLESSCGELGMGDRMDLVFADIDLVPLLVQENYLNHKPVIAGGPAHH